MSDEYEDNIDFIVHNNNTGESFVTYFNQSLIEDGCERDGKFAFFTHGWMGSGEIWIEQLMNKLLYYRGGCVIFMNYSYYSDNINYIKVISNFEPISNLVTRKLNQLKTDGVSSENMYMFGFSLGARIVMESALNYGTREISTVDRKIFFFLHK
jgi:predicted alpha/beta-fold hydrolase